MSDYAFPADVELIYPPAAERRDLVQEYLDIAEARLLARVPSIRERVASGALPEVLVRAAVVDMVARVIDPAKSMQVTQASAGGFQVGMSAVPGANRVMVLDSDLAGLLPPGTSTARTIRTRVLSWP